MRFIAATSLALALAATAACDEDDPCDSTSDFNGQMCLPKSTTADAAIAGGDAPPVSEAGAGGPTFGTTCTDDAQCLGPDTNYCAKEPTGATGTCTKTGCVAAPSICPQGWSCQDLSAFMAGMPSICIPPS
jgi:hypothetical protein